jgi:hypothetical protein
MKNNDLIEKAQTVRGAAHTIESKVLELKGHLLKYVGTIDFKKEHLTHDCILEDGIVSAEWNPEGRLITLAGSLPFGDMEKNYRLVVIEKI